MEFFHDCRNMIIKKMLISNNILSFYQMLITYLLEDVEGPA